MRRTQMALWPLAWAAACAWVLALRSIVVVAVAIGAWVAAPPTLIGQVTGDDCVACHVSMGVERLTAPAQSYAAVDVHAERGFTCLDCHRRDDSSLNPHAGFGGAPRRAEIPEMCGQCHSDAEFMRQFNPGIRVDQVTEYWTSGHGQRLLESEDPGVATCVDCHPAHQIRSVSDARSSVYPANVVATCGSCHADPSRMSGRSIGTDQVAAYRSGVHGRMLFEEGDLSAPACNDCHGNHGAAPVGLSSVRNVCGQCHLVMADYFTGSGHQELFDLVGMPGCVTCHGNHAIETASDAQLVTLSAQVCLQCHQSGDDRGRAFVEMAEILDSLHMASTRSLDVLHEAEDLGMEVSQALFDLEEVNDALHRARSAIHTFRVDSVRREVEAGHEVALAGLERGEAALRENRFRRVGLGFSSAIILFLIGALILKIRDMDTRAGLLETEPERLTVAGREAQAGPRGVSGADTRTEV
jgi:predicted CXXCH cytochrome family protein